MKIGNYFSAHESTECDILVTGCGSLGTAIAESYGSCCETRSTPLRIVVVSRSLKRASELSLIAQMKAAALGGRVTVSHDGTDWSESQLRELIAKYRPRLIIHTASLHSPWKRSIAETAWDRLIKDCGYGVTAALHCLLAERLQKVIAESGREVLLLNCCYPDVVNPILNSRGGCTILGGGNVSIIEMLWRTGPGVQKELRIIAHHAHVAQLTAPPASRSHFPRVWDGDEEVADVRSRLSRAVLPNSDILNRVTGCSIALTSLACLGDITLETHMAGVLGLKGGYPVRIHDGVVALNLPSSISAVQTQQMMQTAQELDGIACLEADRVTYMDSVAKTLRESGSRFSDGFSFGDLAEAVKDLFSVRERLQGGRQCH